MEDQYSEKVILGQNLNEIESRLRESAEIMGLEPIERDPLAIEFLGDVRKKPQDKSELSDYLDGVEGVIDAKLILRAEENGEAHPISEGIDIKIQFDNERFPKVFDAVNEEFNVQSTAFSFLGYGETASEAYEDAVPMMEFQLYDESGFTVTNGDEEAIVRSLWAENPQNLRSLYNILEETCSQYDGAVLDEKDDAWIICDYGAVEPSDMI